MFHTSRIKPPEHLLLTHAIRGDRLSEIPSSIDWASLSQTLFKEQLAPLFYEWLQGESLLKGHLPERLLSDLQQSYLHSAAMNTRRREHLKTLLIRFNEARIPVILHKGIILADEVYKGIAARPMIDVDLIVREEDLGQVEGIVQSAGLPVIVDLHLDIINTDRFKMIQKKPSLRIRRMWEQSRAVIFEGIPTHALSHEDQIIALSIHLAFNHRLQGLLWFADLVRLLKRYGAISPPPFILPPQVGEDRGEGAFSWNLLVERSREYENARSVFYCLKFLKEKLGVSIPDEILTSLRPSRQGWVEKILLKRVWEGRSLGRMGYFLSLPLLENRKLRRRYFWFTLVTLRGLSLLDATGTPKKASCHT